VLKAYATIGNPRLKFIGAVLIKHLHSAQRMKLTADLRRPNQELRSQHQMALIRIIHEHGGSYGNGIGYAYSMAHKAPQSAKNPHIVKK
jgi:hypothetical protein